eukprot:scaffold3159_cov393-Prasinococcus_capsulatus_cf.AAC.3
MLLSAGDGSVGGVVGLVGGGWVAGSTVVLADGGGVACMGSTNSIDGGGISTGALTGSNRNVMSFMFSKGLLFVPHQ